MPTQCITWEERELSRFIDGTYKAMPLLPEFDGITWIPSHYLHLSVKGEPDMIAYTPTADKGEADRQVSMKFGRYLKQFYSLDDVAIHACVVALRTALNAKPEALALKIARDRETINRIFETQMNACNSSYVSCMHDKFTDWKDRPYHVYADSPDVALAYIEVNGRIIARTVVSTKNMRYVRTYAIDGCEEKCSQLVSLLKAAGYTHGNLEGSRLTKLPKRGNKDVLPYLDGACQYVSESDGYWVVTDGDGEYECENTDGTGRPSGPRCSSCGEPEDDCECSYCECCEERYPDGCDNCRFCEQCEGCMEHNGRDCDRCSECSEIISPRSRRVTACECDRCSECGELMDDCDCPEEEPENDSEPESKHETFVPIFYSLSNTYTRALVLASVRFAGHTFLIHRDVHQFKATYAPLGLQAGEGPTIQAVIDGLVARDPEVVSSAVRRALATARENYQAELAPEEGIQS